MERYNKREFRLLIACFVAYTAAYISRTNISPALDAIQSHFGLTAAQVGLIPTLFSLPYAVGQIINGTLADRFNPQRYMTVGLIASALLNLAFSFAQSFTMLMVIWFLNGCVQSMIWTPVVRIFAQDFRDCVRSRGLFHISMTLIVGYICAWAVSGLFTSYLSWRAAFRASGVLTGVMSIGAFVMMNDGQSVKAPTPAAPKERSAEAGMPLMKLLFGTELLFILLCCLFNGYVRDSIMNWAPKMLVDTQGIDLSSAVGVILIIPLINFLGIRCGQILYQKLKENLYKTIILLMLACTAFSGILMLFYGVNVWLCTLLLGLCSAMAYGLNPLFTSFVPMDYRHTNRVGAVAGMIDAMIYLGSAFAGVFAGYLRDWLGWGAVFASWTVFSLVGVAMIWLAIRARKPRA